MGTLSAETLEAARRLISLYPSPRSALVPICHLAQAEHGWLTPEAAQEVAQLLGVTPAEVLGTASFYEMLRTEPGGRYLIGICTNIACMLRGAYELLEHAEATLGVRAGGTTPDGAFSLEETECVADCGRAPCLQVNYRFFGDVTFESFDRLVEDLRAGHLDQEVPPHGVLSRVSRQRGLEVPPQQVAEERRRSDAARAERARRGSGSGGGGS